MPSVFVTGCPGAGKSTLCRRVAEETGATHIYIDGLKKVFKKSEALRPWVRFFSDQDEADYWRRTNPEEHWQNMVDQSTAFWPRVRRVVRSFQEEHPTVIVDGSNMLPHLVKQDFTMPGMVLLPSSEQVLFERLQQEPRWARTRDLQRVEAHRYWLESQRYAKEAREYGYEVFENADAAHTFLVSVLKEEYNAARKHL